MTGILITIVAWEVGKRVIKFTWRRRKAKQEQLKATGQPQLPKRST